ncbi:Imm50 family immunity protein [Streptomyces millisiae]|uniref:Imm50 family immunity protein n=1 Tax=Streptomyces millisiae TaxID=3075542 RepID=A0ABU2LQN2_9ACTN|nr:Imm50 family immunity protein [Streptomyces sp. DSM 44918]MDT0319901.1 Imm50 family immunity protein [Streptomyces sp. DSM 44918]
MPLPWTDLLTNGEQLGRYFTTPPILDGAVLGSLHLDRDGPTLTLRFRLAGLPDRPDEAWVAAGCDGFEFQVRFLDVADVRVVGWPFGASVSVEVSRREPAHLRRIAVSAVGGDGQVLAFTSNASLTVGHLAATRSRDDTFWHVGRVDQIRLGDSLPDTTDHAYWGRL